MIYSLSSVTSFHFSVISSHCVVLSAVNGFPVGLKRSIVRSTVSVRVGGVRPEPSADTITVLMPSSVVESVTMDRLEVPEQLFRDVGENVLEALLCKFCVWKLLMVPAYPPPQFGSTVKLIGAPCGRAKLGGVTSIVKPETVRLILTVLSASPGNPPAGGVVAAVIPPGWLIPEKVMVAKLLYVPAASPLISTVTPTFCEALVLPPGMNRLPVSFAPKAWLFSRTRLLLLPPTVPVQLRVEPTAPLFETVTTPVGLALPCGVLKHRLGDTQGALGVVDTASVATGSQMILKVRLPPGSRYCGGGGSTVTARATGV